MTCSVSGQARHDARDLQAKIAGLMDAGQAGRGIIWRSMQTRAGDIIMR